MGHEPGPQPHERETVHNADYHPCEDQRQDENRDCSRAEAVTKRGDRLAAA